MTPMDAPSPMDVTQTHDAATVDDKATMDEPEAAADAPTCDADNDKWAAQGSCGGLDCDDNDPNANPGVTQFLTLPPTPKTQGDWNCDGRVDKRFKTNVSCGLLDLGSCDNTFGFTGDPVCGNAGPFVQCKASGLLCGQGTLTTNVQGCR